MARLTPASHLYSFSSLSLEVFPDSRLVCSDSYTVFAQLVSIHGGFPWTPCLKLELPPALSLILVYFSPQHLPSQHILCISLLSVFPHSASSQKAPWGPGFSAVPFMCVSPGLAQSMRSINYSWMNTWLNIVGYNVCFSWLRIGVGVGERGIFKPENRSEEWGTREEGAARTFWGRFQSPCQLGKVPPISPAVHADLLVCLPSEGGACGAPNGEMCV